MAASLRHPLSWLVWLAMAVIYLPLLPTAAILFATAQQPAAVAARRSSCGLCHQRFTIVCRRGPVVSGV